MLDDEQEMREQGFDEFAVGGIVEQGEAQFGVSVPGMRAFSREGKPCFCVLCMVMGIAMLPEFALKVGRKNRVDGSRVDMTGFAVMRIRLGMDMEERQGKQPQDCPCAKQVIESDEFVMHGTHGHSLLRRRYHRERNTSRSGQKSAVR